MEQHPLKSWRSAQGLTQSEAGERLGLSRWSINQIETGAYKPAPTTAKELAAATGIEPSVFRPDIFDSSGQEAPHAA